MGRLLHLRAMTALYHRRGVVALIALLAFAADQGSKLGIVRTLPLGSSWPSEGFVRFTHVANTGSAFGLFGGHNFVLTVASIVGIGVLLLLFRSYDRPGVWAQCSLGLMLAGAFGNLTDRIVRGHVTDFIDVGPWYIFNLADASIVTGIVIFAGVVQFARPSPKPALAAASIPGDEEYRD